MNPKKTGDGSDPVMFFLLNKWGCFFFFRKIVARKIGALRIIGASKKGGGLTLFSGRVLGSPNHQWLEISWFLGWKWCSHDPHCEDRPNPAVGTWVFSPPGGWRFPELLRMAPLSWESSNKMSEFLVFKPGMITKGLSRRVYASIRGCVNTHLNYILYFIIYIYKLKKEKHIYIYM